MTEYARPATITAREFVDGGYAAKVATGECDVTRDGELVKDITPPPYAEGWKVSFVLHNHDVYVHSGSNFTVAWFDGDEDFVSDEEYQRLEEAAFGGHKDVWIEVDGHRQRVLGDPNMSEETKQALAEMIKAITKEVNEGHFDGKEK